MTEIKKISSEQLADLVTKYAMANDYYLVIDRSVYLKYSTFGSWDKTRMVVVEFPEKEKTFAGYEKLATELLEKGIKRNSTILAVGGGALSDLAGFVAATINRGIKWIVIPTTLLSQVDAALGGKVAINTKVGKNLIGAFHAPTQLYLNDDFLKTLPEKEYQSGVGEILKYGLLSESIYQMLRTESIGPDLIEKCLQYKEWVVENDPMENKGLRKILNLGHSLGHAYELLFDLPHGLAVMKGLIVLGREFFPKVLTQNLNPLIDHLKLNSIVEQLDNLKVVDAEQFWRYVSHDKKAEASSIDLVLLKKIGEPYVQRMSIDDLKGRIIP